MGRPRDLLGYTIVFSVSAPLESQEPDTEYIHQIDAVILAEYETLQGGERQVNVGSVKAMRIDSDRARDAGESLWDVCDACEQETANCYMELFLPESEEPYEYKPSVQEFFPDAHSLDVLLIDLVRVDPAHRGANLGLRAVRRTIDLFGPGMGLVVCRPFPLQFNAEHREFRREVPPELAVFTTGERESFTKLERHWESMGFQRIPGTAYWGLCTANRLPDIKGMSDAD
jgi:hypothetical protein